MVSSFNDCKVGRIAALAAYSCTIVHIQGYNRSFSNFHMLNKPSPYLFPHIILVDTVYKSTVPVEVFSVFEFPNFTHSFSNKSIQFSICNSSSVFWLSCLSFLQLPSLLKRHVASRDSIDNTERPTTSWPTQLYPPWQGAEPLVLRTLHARASPLVKILAENTTTTRCKCTLPKFPAH